MSNLPFLTQSLPIRLRPQILHTMPELNTRISTNSQNPLSPHQQKSRRKHVGKRETKLANVPIPYPLSAK